MRSPYAHLLPTSKRGGESNVTSADGTRMVVLTPEKAPLLRFWPKQDDAAEPDAQLLVAEARLIEGSRRTLVKLMLAPHAIAYSVMNVRRTIDLRAIQRVEYASYFVNGTIPNGTMLRLSCADQTLEFVLDSNGDEWLRRLPPTCSA